MDPLEGARRNIVLLRISSKISKVLSKKLLKQLLIKRNKQWVKKIVLWKKIDIIIWNKIHNQALLSMFISKKSNKKCKILIIYKRKKKIGCWVDIIKSKINFKLKNYNLNNSKRNSILKRENMKIWERSNVRTLKSSKKMKTRKLLIKRKSWSKDKEMLL